MNRIPMPQQQPPSRAYPPQQPPYPQQAQPPYYAPQQPPRQSPQPQPSQQPQQPQKPPKKGLPLDELLPRIFVGTLSVFVLAYMGWLFAPRIRNAMTFWPTHTPTPITPTPTLPATATITPLPSNTPTLAPTATPGPISDYFIRDGNTLDPAVPNAPDGLVILTAKDSADVNPALDSIYWTGSSQIVQDLGMMNSLYDSEWYATMHNGAIRFYMDRILNEGLYEIYVMDTYYSSGGDLDYSVRLGEETLSPMTGSNSVSFMTSQYEPRQSMDTWRSIGIYYVRPSHDVLTVSTAWDTRDQYTYVAADRVMIVPRRITDLSLLNALPSTGTKFIMDDTQAKISNARSSLFDEDVSAAWDDSYQLLINPKEEVKVEYSSKEPWPIGKYALYLYIPASKGGIDATVELYTDNVLHANVQEENAPQIHIPSEGGWLKVGDYKTDRYYERPVKFKVVISVPEGQSGEYPIDALALIREPFDD